MKISDLQIVAWVAMVWGVIAWLLGGQAVGEAGFLLLSFGGLLQAAETLRSLLRQRQQRRAQGVTSPAPHAGVTGP